MDKNISERIKTLGFVMTCIIVMYHCGAVDIEPINVFDDKMNGFVNGLFNSLEEVAMSYFFITTGYLLFYNYKNEVKRKIIKRVRTLLVPYVIWNTVASIMWLYEGKWEKFLRKTFLLEQWPYDFPLWYIYVVFLCALLSPIIYMLLRNKEIGFAILVLLSVLCFCIPLSQNDMVRKISGYGLMPQILTNMSAYLFGVYLGIHGRDVIHDLELCLAMLLCAFIINSYYEGFLVFYTIKIIPVFLILLLPSRFTIKNYKLINLSFLIYAMHAFTGKPLKVIYPYVAQVFPSATFVNVFRRGFSVFFNIVCAYVVWMILAKVSPSLLSWITGNRVKSKI